MRQDGDVDRRTAIADAGITLVATAGVRALTHRAVDAQAGLPSGSTSYYARTRRELVDLLVHRLSARTLDDVRDVTPPTDLSAPVVADALAGLLDTLALRPDEHRARFALLLELADDEAGRALLTTDAPVRAVLLAQSRGLMIALGVVDPDARAADLVALVDALLWNRVSGAPAIDTRAVFEAYVRGLCPA